MEDMDKLIYVVDDEPQIRELLVTYLLNSNYRVEQFADGAAALARFQEQRCDMLIIDIMMPVMDGYELCRRIREISDVPIIMVSARDDEVDKVLGLELGSDDYLSKPFAPRELIARVHSIFRRSELRLQDKDNGVEVDRANIYKDNSANNIKIADVIIVPDERRVTKGAEDIPFTTKEFSLILYLSDNKNKVFTREQIISNIWGYDYYGDTRSVDDLVKRIRKKLSEYDTEFDIKTVWGYGYKITD